MKVLAAFLSFVLALYGCGGGGGGGSSRPPDVFHNAAHVVAGPNQTVEDARQAPVIDFDGMLHIGAGVELDISELTPAGAHGDVSISSGHVRDGAGRDATVAFFSQFFGDPKGLRSFREQPVVRVAQGTSAAHTDMVVRAVQILNAYLPRENRMIFSDIPSPYGADLTDVPTGEIHINFGPFGEQIPENFRTYRGYANTARSIDFNYETGLESTYARASRIWMNTNRLHQFTYEANVGTLYHELMHSIALSGHADAVRYPLSFIRSRSPRGFSRRILGPIDRDVIAAAFAYVPSATSAEELGPWSDTSFHLRGDIEDVAFGVASFNGLLQPWASGPTPTMDLTNNPVLSGTATWSGAILGITPSEQTVVGDAQLEINMTKLNGQLDFTNMEYMTGGTWSDGGLNYSVRVRGYTFMQTGGDAGEVTGAFFGPDHEGMGGVVERSDMSAGFAGVR